MPNHDPTPPAEDIADPAMPEPSAPADATRDVGYGTRSARRAAIVDGWRADALSHVTAPATWIMSAVVYLLLLAGAVLAADPMASTAIAVTATAAAWSAWWIMLRRDRKFRWLATLTPVVDRTTLEGETTILVATVDALTATLRNRGSDANARLQAVQGVMWAAAAIMRRGSVTPQDATVDGYPAWPEVDRTEMPGQPGDFLSVHLMRVDATARRLVSATSEKLLFEETVARIAGEVVPPLRAMEAVIAPVATTA